MFIQTLILNQEYRPHKIVTWQDAVTSMFKGSIEILVQYDEVLTRLDRRTLNAFPDLKKALRQVIGTDTESLEIKVPAVAVLRRRINRYKSGVKFSRINVHLRDDFTCQYCDKKLPMSMLNKDHVVPRAQGGRTVWDNIVTSCIKCNDKKADKTPEEAGMQLLVVPVKPKVLPMNEPYIDPRKAPPEWAPYIRAA